LPVNSALLPFIPSRVLIGLKMKIFPAGEIEFQNFCGKQRRTKITVCFPGVGWSACRLCDNFNIKKSLRREASACQWTSAVNTLQRFCWRH